MISKKVVVAGATGLVGNAALRHFGSVGACEVVALSRRKPRELYGARHHGARRRARAAFAATARRLRTLPRCRNAARRRCPRARSRRRPPPSCLSFEHLPDRLSALIANGTGRRQFAATHYDGGNSAIAHPA